MHASLPQAALVAAAITRGVSLIALSRLLGRNDAYLNQFVNRGSPRRLAERDRRWLAAYLDVDETVLGAEQPATPGPARLRRLDVRAAAGAGGLAEEDRATGTVAVDPAELARLRVRPDQAAIITAQGDSMAPLIADGDELLVDTADRRLGPRPALMVVRLDGALLVKHARVARGRVLLESLNPMAAAIAPQLPAAVELVGRVVRLTRALR